MLRTQSTLLIASLLALAAPGSADAATYTVTTTADFSLLSTTLTDAINSANNNSGLDTIEFSLSTNAGGYDAATGTWTLTLNGSLPSITSPVIIDGTSQSGAAPVRVFIDADGASTGLSLLAGSDGSSLIGLGVGGASTAGVLVSGSGGHVLDGCWIGAHPDGNTARANGQDGVRVASGSGITIGTLGGEPNVLSGNGRHGLFLDGSGVGASTLLGAYVGTDADGGSPLPNGGDGVRIGSASGHTIGDPAAPNLIAWNTGAGVAVLAAGTSSGNEVVYNDLHDNGGLGLDLGGDGPTLNDTSDGDAGPNGRLNFPVIDWAGMEGGEVVIAGWTRPGTTVSLLLAAPDPTGFGEGAWLDEATEGSADDLDSATSSYTGPAGSDSTTRFRFALPANGLGVGSQIALLASNAAGSTSELGLVTPLEDLDSDTDNDGLTLGEEYLLGLDPSDSDTDDDGIIDGVELSGSNPTDPLDSDSDDDGLLDGDEDLDGDGTLDPTESDPNSADTDSDGVSDFDEGALGTSPVDDDSDDDGILDGNEGALGTDPTEFDTDGDLLGDGLEIGLSAPQGDDTANFTPDGDAGATTTSPLLDDTDGGTVLDGSEDANKNGVLDAGEGDPNDPNDDLTLLDSDMDGLTDAAETNAGSDPNNPDSDGDGIPDAIDGLDDSDFDGIVDAMEVDSDNDGLLDEVEDADRDGVVDPGETDPEDPDTDDDGLLDGEEDVNGNGTVDAGETDPLNADTDGDGVSDGFETSAGTSPLLPDTDSDGLTDDVELAGPTNPLLADTDGDGLSDLEEVNGVTDPTLADTDNDGLSDLAEVNGPTDPLDPDSDDDTLLDGDEDADGDGVVDPNETDPLDDDTDNDGIIDGNEAGLGTNPRAHDTDGDGLSDGLEIGLAAPQGDDTLPASFQADADAGATTTLPTVADTDGGGVTDGGEDANLDGTIDIGEGDPNDPNDDATLVDSDNDGLTDAAEANAGTQPLNPDSDGDGVPDGADGLGDADGDGDIDALDPDSDNDGLGDGEEDANQNGIVDPGETSADLADTDGDGLDDGDEAAAGSNPLDPDSDDDGLLDGAEVMVGTDPNDDDSDDDGLLDGDEDADQDGQLDVGETDPMAADSDQDGLPDGLELGLTAPQGDDTNPAVFVADLDPSTTTDPLDADTDDGGILDGVEDSNRNGRIDGIEGDPNDPTDDGLLVDSDNDGLPDGAEADAGTDPNLPDTDGDGLGDALEVLVSPTDPLDDDSDDDGLLDGSEDQDGDGVVGLGETDPMLRDTDEDGLSDGLEVGLTAAQGTDTSPGAFAVDADPSTTTDPLDSDTDGGGVPDGDEDANRNGRIDEGEGDPNDAADDPYQVDSDGDGLSDGDELDAGLDPFDADTDGDGVPDPADGLTDTDGDGRIDALDTDSDNDGLLDGEEDVDGDGQHDPSETDAHNPDTDGDGLNDGLETRIGSDPLAPERTQGSGASCSQGGDGPSWLFMLPMVLLFARRRRSAAPLGLAMALLVTALPASAAEPALPRLDVQRFDPIPQGPGLLRVRDPELLTGLAGTGGFTINYSLRPFELGAEDGTRSVGIVENLIGFDVYGAFAFANLFQVGVAMPVLQLAPGTEASRELSKALGGSGGTLGVGDLRIEFGVQALRQARHGLSLAVTPRAVLPTGTRAMFVGGGALGLGIDAAVGRRWKHLRLAGNVGFQVNLGGSDLLGVRADDELRWGVGVGVPFLDDRMEVGVEWTGATVIDPVALADVGVGPFSPRLSPSELTGHVRLDPPGPMAFVVGGGRGIGPGWGTPDVRVFAAIQVHPERRLDDDRDGIPNATDLCRDAAETFNGVYDDDGCPEADADADGVGDEKDLCPDKAEDRDGFADDDGCPDLDNDADGVPDTSDDCPLKGEDIDGFADEDGCPDLDNDADGIADLDDACPMDAERYNGHDDEDGCPDEGLAALEREGGKAVRIVIFERVYFETGSDRINPVSHGVLSAVAEVLAAFPEVERLEIGGHTDSVGDDAYNLDLSARRAEAVLRFLAERGVSPERLVAQGFGESVPIDDNATDEGRQKNRRVEFLVLDQGAR